MSGEVVHQKTFEAALVAIESNFPPGTLPGDEKLNHDYFQAADSYGNDGASGSADGFSLVQQNSQWGFDLDQNTADHASEQEVQ